MKYYFQASYREGKAGGQGVSPEVSAFMVSNSLSLASVKRNTLRDRFVSLKMQLFGPGSSFGIATGYGLNGSGMESRWGRDFPHLFRPALGSTQPPVQCVPGLSRG
jgi:hypothetical protein